MTKEPVDFLAEALKKATQEPAYWPDFFPILMKSTVFILGSVEGSAADAPRPVAVSTNEISVFTWRKDDGTTVVPFFSSLIALQRAIDQQSPFVQIPVRTLLEMTKGAFLTLNPKSECSKEFSPKEVEALLSSGVTNLPDVHVNRESRQVAMGEPANQPEQMVSSLALFFKKHKTVRSAHLALMTDLSNGNSQQLVIGIEVEGEFDQIIREAGVIVKNTGPGGVPIMMTIVGPGRSEISDYFLTQSRAFYRRA